MATTPTTTPTTDPTQSAGAFATLIQKFLSPTPTTFAILRNISLVVTIVAALPTLLTALGITLPAAYTGIFTKIVSGVAFLGAVVAQLQTTDTTTTTPPTSAS